jgi:hypothetical protein
VVNGFLVVVISSGSRSEWLVGWGKVLSKPNIVSVLLSLYECYRDCGGNERAIWCVTYISDWERLEIQNVG